MTINVDPSGGVDDFRTHDLVIGVAAAEARAKKLPPEQTFSRITLAYLQILSELRDKQDGFYWKSYVDFFTALKAAKHDTAFAYLIQTPSSDAARQWVAANKESVLMMRAWLRARLASP
jgi:hypothetical protein